MSNQRDTFVGSEGDAWFCRNEEALTLRDWSKDPVSAKVQGILSPGAKSQVLEIGCGDGSRLEHLAATAGYQVFGVDPSQKAVARAIERGVQAHRSTADRLPFADASFDAVVFGFCLYLCDDSDLFRIACEADRVLACPGWLIIFDFEAPSPTYRAYQHLAGLRSRKMDYKSMFLWHPLYTLASYEKFHHGNQRWTDDRDEWVGLSCLRKQQAPE